MPVTGWVVEQQRPPHDHYDRFLEEPVLVRATLEGGKANIIMSHPIVPIITRELIGWFNAMKGINLVELLVVDEKDQTPYTLTLHKSTRPSAQELIAKMRGALEIVHGWSSTLEGAKIAAEMALEDCGYLPKRLTKNANTSDGDVS